jgi:hypothetical protein
VQSLPEQVHPLLDASSDQLRVMILLALNAGLGNSDLAHLQRCHISGGFLSYPKRKTCQPRRAHLWPETLAAIQAVQRPMPKDRAHADHVFLTRCGKLWTSESSIANPISAFRKEERTPEKEAQMLVIDGKLSQLSDQFPPPPQLSVGWTEKSPLA